MTDPKRPKDLATDYSGFERHLKTVMPPASTAADLNIQVNHGSMIAWFRVGILRFDDDGQVAVGIAPPEYVAGMEQAAAGLNNMIVGPVVLLTANEQDVIRERVRAGHIIIESSGFANFGSGYTDKQPVAVLICFFNLAFLSCLIDQKKYPMEARRASWFQAWGIERPGGKT